MDVHGMRVFARVAALSNISAATRGKRSRQVSKRCRRWALAGGGCSTEYDMIRNTEEGEMLLRSVTGFWPK